MPPEQELPQRSWTHEAKRAWRNADKLARHEGAATLDASHVFHAVLYEPEFRERRVLEAHAPPAMRPREEVRSRLSGPAERPYLPLADDAEQLREGVVALAEEAGSPHLDRPKLAEVFAQKPFSALSDAGFDRRAFAAHLHAPQAEWDAHAKLAEATREVQQLRTEYGRAHVATVQANDKRLAAMLNLAASAASAAKCEVEGGFAELRAPSASGCG